MPKTEETTNFLSKFNPMTWIAKIDIAAIESWVVDHVKPISAETLGWIGVLLVHGSTLPIYFTLFTGVNDQPPPIDMTMLIWLGLTALFAQAAVLGNRAMLITIALGFIIQSFLMALIFFR